MICESNLTVNGGQYKLNNEFWAPRGLSWRTTLWEVFYCASAVMSNRGFISVKTLVTPGCVCQIRRHSSNRPVYSTAFKLNCAQRVRLSRHLAAVEGMNFSWSLIMRLTSRTASYKDFLQNWSDKIVHEKKTFQHILILNILCSLCEPSEWFFLLICYENRKQMQILLKCTHTWVQIQKWSLNVNIWYDHFYS